MFCKLEYFSSNSKNLITSSFWSYPISNASIPSLFKYLYRNDLISQDDVIEISNINSSLENGTDFEITVTGKNGTKSIIGTNSLDERSRAILKAGGLASYTRMGGQ